MRVLKPGGTLSVTTWGPGDPRWDWLDHIDPRPAQENKEDKPRYDEPEWMKALLQKAGFTNVDVSLEEREFFFADEEDWWATTWSHGARLFLEQVPPQALERVKSVVHQKLQEMQQPEGIPMIYDALYSVATKAE